MIPRVLSIAGTDPTGGAGVQADLKSIQAMGGYGMAAVTCLVAQNTRGVSAIHTPPTEFFAQQLESVFSDVAVDAVKIGMLGDEDIVTATDAALAAHPVDVLVIDPVMVATSGDVLLSEDAIDALRRLLARATVITPNVAELAVLLDQSPATTMEEAVAQGGALAERTGAAVVVKGGHLSGAADNCLVFPDGRRHRVPCPRVDSPHTHGTGCSLSSALATCLGAGMGLPEALERATAWLRRAIIHAADLHVGEGHGPVDHSYQHRAIASFLGCPAAPPVSPVDAAPSADAVSPAEQSAPDPAVAPAGPATRRMWRESAQIWEEVLASDLIRDLAAGAPDRPTPADFACYLAQDRAYLPRYSRALSMLSATAPTANDQLFWSQSASECLVVEGQMHEELAGQLFPAGTAQASMSRICAGYTDFLLATAATEPYPVAAAAVLPCFWYYAEVGRHLASVDVSEHPFGSWIEEYDSPDFLASAEAAIDAVERSLADAGEDVLAQASRAFRIAAAWERDFFRQPELLT